MMNITGYAMFVATGAPYIPRGSSKRNVRILLRITPTTVETTV